MFKRKTLIDDLLADTTAEVDDGNYAVAVLEPEPIVPVMERAKSAVFPVECDIDYYEATDELARLTRESKSLLGIENQAKLALIDRISSVQRDVTKVKAHRICGTDVKRLSMEVLTWRKSNPVRFEGVPIPTPEVAMFGLNDHNCRLSTDGWSSHGSCSPALTPALNKCYQDVYDSLGQFDARSHYNRGHALFAVFEGVIPAETKTRIREAQQSKAFSDIRVLAEADWEVDVRPHPRLADPIVVGLVNDEMWVIDIFDPTPLEDYIAREFIT